MKKRFLKILLFLPFFLLLFFSQASFLGAKDGLILWFHTVVPTLFPFMVLCRELSFYFPSSILLGLLSGYPLGAIMVSDMLCRNKDSLNRPLPQKPDIQKAQILLGCINIASPMFMSVYVCEKCLLRKDLVVLNLLCVYTGTLLGSLIFYLLTHPYPKLKEKAILHINKNNNQMILVPLSDIIIDCASKLVVFGGYIILFSIIINIFRQIVHPDSLIDGIITCTIEFTNGFHLIGNAYNSHLISFRTAFSIILFFESFGCLSVFAQTQSVIQGSGLNLYKYIFQKFLCGLCSATFFYFLLYFQ